MNPVMPAADAAERYRALLAISDVIALQPDLPGLLHELSARLERVVPCEFINFVLYDAGSGRMRLHVAEASGGLKLAMPAEAAIEEAPSGWVWANQQPLIYDDITETAEYPLIIGPLRAGGIRACCWVPLTTAGRRLGALSFGSRQAGAYHQSETEFLSHVAAQVALALDSVAHRERAQTYQRQLAAERDRLQLLLEINNLLIANLDARELFNSISESLRRITDHDYASLALCQPDGSLRLHALAFAQGKGLVHEDYVFPAAGSLAGAALAKGEPVLASELRFEDFPSEVTRRMLEEGVRCACVLPLFGRNGALGTLGLASVREGACARMDLELLTQVARQISLALDNALAYAQIGELRDKLAEERLYLEDEIRTTYNFEEIIGESAGMKNVLAQVETVAATNASVLVLGETGTGKELIARAIHDLSPRRERTFVKLNCAAIPTGLLESELFGHEKGAFTGAIAQKIGRVELADGGTLFLDEVGDIPLELQPKLLRVLQEREFERLGSNRTKKVDVRVVAATNRNLPEMVSRGQFRGDLFYRLNVFPVQVPALRDRAEDIPLLVRYFAQKHARAMDRRIQTIPAETMQVLARWPWPGNVRELENLIERAVILSRGPVLEVPLAELSTVDVPEPAAAANSHLDQAEREHILRVLRETNGRIAGPDGAAARLGLKRTTLNFKLKKLGITRQDI
jgi:formate hydrogenlyase transcriptional activator